MDGDQYSNALAAHTDDEEDDGSSFVQGISAGHHVHSHSHSQSDAASFASHADFGRPGLSIDPGLSAHAPPDHRQQQQQHQDDDPHHHGAASHYGDQHMEPQLYTDLSRNTNQYTLDTPSEQPSEPSPSQFASASPAPTLSKNAPSFTPTDRSLPDKRVSDATLDDAYVSFILYCNPSIPLDCDTTELRKVFRQPPKSDGKTFNVFHLLELIEKFERKDIKTWSRLAIELGVERTPDSSAQKVQQYAVRLKRWMHAMHVDSFFEYILNKPHRYYQHIPPIEHDPNLGTSDRVRDGVPVEEDLALRALHPETRPKRGRRKIDDKDDVSEKDAPSAKRQHMDTGAPASAVDMRHFDYPDSAVPSSAGGGGGMGYMDDAVSQDQWTAATQSVLGGSASTPTGNQQFRWRAYPKIDTSSTTSHPPPNILSSHDSHTPADEAMTPMTATPTSGKPRRRRHGPAVSSAWPSSGNPLTGKLRGRPPSNRSVRDGPFSTFPANPSAKGGSTIDMSPVTATPTSTPILSHPPPHQFPQYRPHNLHLTVPHQPGQPITMVTPTVERHSNGGSPLDWLHPSQQPKAEKPHPGLTHHQPPHHHHHQHQHHSDPIPRSFPSFEDLRRQFTMVILQSHVDGDTRVELDDANLIAEEVLDGFRRMYPDSDKAALLTGTTSSGPGFKDLRIHKLQNEILFGLHVPDPDDDDDDDDDTTDNTRGVRGERRYQISWHTSFGELEGKFQQTVTLPALQRDGDEFDGLAAYDADGGRGKNVLEGLDELRKRVQDLESRLRLKERDLTRFRDDVLRVVLP